MSRFETWASVLVVLITTGTAAAFGWWVGSTPPRPIEVYVHFDQPLVVKLVKEQ